MKDTNSRRLEMRAQAAPWMRCVEFAMWDTSHGARSCAEYITFRASDETVTTEPLFSLSYEAAQTLMDDLWNAGLRPTEGTGSAGALAATQLHLDDMRKLSLRLLEEYTKAR